LISNDSVRVLIVALLLDAVIGDPDWLWQRVPHPVVLFGRLIDRLDRLLNNPDWSDGQRRAAGGFAMIVLIVIAAGLGSLISSLLRSVYLGWLLEALIASIFLAQRTLYEHVAEVRAALARGGLSEARRAVSAIVGRDPQSLDEAGVCRAAIETTAENFSDGVVAPAFWFALFGLPGIMVCKAINTADSMIGHLDDRHRSFGWAAARLDDAINFVPARLSAMLIALVAPLSGGSLSHAFTVTWCDARRHRSPNAGWPESAMAGALNVALAGPRSYAGEIADDPLLNASARAATPDDIVRALQLFVAACAVEVVFYAALAFVG
jgi:adenosylcobinamide-phosphate synthase